MRGLRARLIVGVLGATVVVAALAAVIGFIWQSDRLRLGNMKGPGNIGSRVDKVIGTLPKHEDRRDNHSQIQ